MENVQGFDWDDANVAHILRRAVTPFEVEETTGGRCFIIPAKTIKRERRWKLFWQNGFRAIPRGRVYYSPEAFPDGDGLRNGCSREE